MCTILSNPWNFICRLESIFQKIFIYLFVFISSELTTTRSLVEYSQPSETTAMPSHLNSWQLGLICGFSMFLKMK